MPDFTFQRNRRLLKGADFQRVFDNSEIRVSHPKLLLLASTSDLGHARVGMVVSKKNCRKAVQRNRIKRVVRETFREAQSELNSLDVVFLARRGLNELEPAEQTRLLQDSWKRLSRRVKRNDFTR